MLELTGLSRRFGGLTVIDDLALQVAQGEIVGILGPNGAGKSTLFNLIGGNLAPNAGRVAYAGRTVKSFSLDVHATLPVNPSSKCRPLAPTNVSR